MRTHAVPSDIEGIDLRKIVRMVHGIPDRVRATYETTYLRSRELLDDGASFGEISRTLGVGRDTLRRWFPGRGWTPNGSSSSMIRRAQKEMEGL